MCVANGGRLGLRGGRSYGLGRRSAPPRVAHEALDVDFDLMVRAHQVVEDGYEFFAQRQLVTLFSAPNYCGEFDNAGAIMSIDETLMCSFHILKPAVAIDTLSPAQDRRPTGLMGGGARRPATPMPPPGKR